MSEPTTARKIATFWTLPDAEAKQLVRKAQQSKQTHETPPAEEPKRTQPPRAPVPPQPVMSYAESLAAGGRIADALDEHAGAVRFKIRRIVRYFGIERCEAWLSEAQAIYAGDGMLTPDGSRRRTLGGIFFVLVKRSPDRTRVQFCCPRRPRSSAADG